METSNKGIGRDIGKLVSGTLVAQIVGICLYPIITRLFSPESYGLYSVFISTVSVLTICSCLRYELAILLPDNDEDGGSLCLVALLIVLLFSVALAVVLLIFGDSLLDLLNMSELADYMFMIPILVLINGLFQALRYWNTRRKRFGTQAFTQALQSLSDNGSKTGFGMMGYTSSLSLLLSSIFGNLLGLLILSFQTLRKDFKILKSSLSIRKIKQQLIRYKKFPLIDLWSGLMNNLSWQLPTLMLSSFFNPAIAGLYSLGYMMILLPMNFVGNSIRQVFVQRAAIAKQSGNLSKLSEEICSTLVVLSVLPYLLLLVLGKDLFSFVFGLEWAMSGVFVQILSIWAVVWFVSSVITDLIYVLELQEYNIRYTAFNLISRFFVLFVGGVVCDVYLALFLFSAVGILTYGHMSYFVLKRAGSSFGNILKNIKWPLILSIIIIMVVTTVSFCLTNSLITYSVAFIGGCIYYALIFTKSPIIKSIL